jgi:ankyrin repeat protein
MSLCSACADGDCRVPVQLALLTLQTIERLIDGGAKVNERFADGLVPLCVAAFWGHEHAVALLLSKGAAINGTNSGTNWTALHCASFQGKDSS